MHILKRWISIDGLPHALERLLLIVMGLVVILLREHFTSYIHIIVGVVMVLLCAVMLHESMSEKSYRSRHDRKLPTAIVGLVLGVLILWHEDNSIPFLAIAWGISGLESGITELDHAVYRIAHRQHCAYHLVHGFIETVLAILLVFDPVEKIGEHILILGLEMLVHALTVREEDEDRRHERHI